MLYEPQVICVARLIQQILIESCCTYHFLVRPFYRVFFRYLCTDVRREGIVFFKACLNFSLSWNNFSTLLQQSLAFNIIMPLALSGFSITNSLLKFLIMSNFFLSLKICIVVSSKSITLNAIARSEFLLFLHDCQTPYRLYFLIWSQIDYVFARMSVSF